MEMDFGLAGRCSDSAWNTIVTERAPVCVADLVPVVDFHPILYTVGKISSYAEYRPIERYFNHISGIGYFNIPFTIHVHGIGPWPV